jgi:hypothetical protein
MYKELGRRGNGETESGAFLLGKAVHPAVETVLYYDDLEPGCLVEIPSTLTIPVRSTMITGFRTGYQLFPLAFDHLGF